VVGFLHWVSGLGTSRELALWVALSVAIYVLCAQLSWRLHDLERGFLGENIRWLDTWRFRQLAWQLLRLLFYAVIPYGLLVQRRLLTGRMLGLTGPGVEGPLGWPAGTWVRGGACALLCGLVGVGLVGGSWWALARRLQGETVFYLHHRPSAWVLAWDAFFLQVHWGFYRAAAGVWVGEAEPYLGILLGLALVGLEAVGDPGLYFDVRWPSLANGWVRLASVWWLTSALFLLTSNLWLCILLHWCLTGALTAVGGRLSRWSLEVSAEPG
jgi:hypothetical protein